MAAIVGHPSTEERYRTISFSKVEHQSQDKASGFTTSPLDPAPPGGHISVGVGPDCPPLIATRRDETSKWISYQVPCLHATRYRTTSMALRGGLHQYHGWNCCGDVSLSRGEGVTSTEREQTTTGASFSYCRNPRSVGAGVRRPPGKSRAYLTLIFLRLEMIQKKPYQLTVRAAPSMCLLIQSPAITRLHLV